MSERTSGKVLLVDDEEGSREAMAEWLTREGFDVIAAADGESATELMFEGVAAVVTDLQMPGVDGLELLRRAKEKAPHSVVILVTGHGTIDSAVAALKEGAFDYLTKPVDLRELSQCVRQALSENAASAGIADLHATLQMEQGYANIVGTSPAMQSVFEKIKLAADVKSTVLVVGESGTGKELVVRALHYGSSRCNMPFVPVNCSAIPENLIEAELFGHSKGAFTGATNRRAGLFEVAHGGTLFIDEIGEMNLGLQSKLLRAIETRRFMPIGSSEEVEVDVRLVFATNRDLREQVNQKHFREDLYYRLKVIEIHLPPLRERQEDIPLLVAAFLKQIAEENERPICEISPAALDVMLSYAWPGNVRELRNMLEGIVVFMRGNRIEISDVPEYIRGSTSAQTVVRSGMSMADIEKEAIRATLERTNGRRSEAGKILGLSVRTLQRKIREYDLPF